MWDRGLGGGDGDEREREGDLVDGRSTRFSFFASRAPMGHGALPPGVNKADAHARTVTQNTHTHKSSHRTCVLHASCLAWIACCRRSKKEARVGLHDWETDGEMPKGKTKHLDQGPRRKQGVNDRQRGGALSKK